MLTNEIASAPAPRPKIHRLPGRPTTKAPRLSLVIPRPKPEKRLPLTAASIAVVLLAIGAIAIRQVVLHRHSTIASAASPDIAKTTPPVEVTESASLLPTPIGDAQAATPARQDRTIVLQGDHERIVGQLAKIPGENEQITEIKAVSDIDNNAGRELLSIISKY